jgi:uncharacterized protein with HEPN domain
MPALCMRREDSFLKDILAACGRIADIVSATTEKAFLDDAVATAAVLRHLTVIGEAAGRLSEDLRQRYEAVPWRQAMGIRNRIVHA